MTEGRTPLTVATWNIRAAIGPGEPFPPAWWRVMSTERLRRIADVIGGLDADVITLQEVAVVNVDGDLTDQPAELARLTGLDVRYAAAGHFAVTDPETGRVAGTSLWGNAVLTRLRIVESWAAGLPTAGDDDLVEPADALDALEGSPHPLAGVRYAVAPTGAREPRVVLRVTVDSPVGPAHVLATHLTHVGAEQRRGQARFIAVAAADLEGTVVLAGDLNAVADSPALAPLLDELDDAFAATGVPAGDPRRASCGPYGIDQVLVRGATVAGCRVVRDAGDTSDHWPVVATLG